MARPAGLGGRFRWPPVQNVLLSIHCLGWLVAMVVVTITSPTHIPPSEMWTALPLGASAILVAFRNGGDHRHTRPPPRHEREGDER